MTPGNGKGGEPGDAESPETGEPVRELSGLTEPPAQDFIGRVRGRINRKVLTNQVTDFGWKAPGLVLIQWLIILMEWVGGSREDSGGKSHE